SAGLPRPRSWARRRSCCRTAPRPRRRRARAGNLLLYLAHDEQRAQARGFEACERSVAERAAEPRRSELRRKKMIPTSRSVILTIGSPLPAASSPHAPVAPPAPTAPPTAAAPPANAGPTASAAGERLSADTARTTASGATFTAPAGWTLRNQGAWRILEGPEPNLHVVLYDSQAANAEAAVAAAWPALHPDFKRPVRFSLPLPARDGWEEGHRYIYETSPNERLVMVASALRKGKGWTVLLLDGAEAPVQRHGSQVGLIGGSLRPHGYARESFKGKTPHALDAARVKQLTE